ncbi:MAG: vitamin B12 dependent-methionine synthase activation domain-containing protein [Planctomycetota bacterium]
MSEIIRFAADALAPDARRVFEHQGMPPNGSVSSAVEAIFAQAAEGYQALAEPVGILANISESQFEDVYVGEGRSERRTPVGELFSLADDLALFAGTLGDAISLEIRRCFDRQDYPLGCMLDSVASVAAEDMAHLAERQFLDDLRSRRRTGPDTAVLMYSPGYCGWDVSGQKKLFAFLRPERVGITLRESCLMEPLKSISGVLIAGPGEIHRFSNTYSFCSACATPTCRERIRTVLAG